MIIGLDPDAKKIELYELIKELRSHGAEVTVEQAGGDVEIVRAVKDDSNVTAGPFLNGYAYSDEIYFGDDRVNELGDWWGKEDGTAIDLCEEMFLYL